VIDAHSGYSSRWFTLEGQHSWPSQWWWKVLFLRIATPERPYFVAFFPIENQRWLLSYIGVNKVYPPAREDEFTAALERLASPVVHDMVRQMEPISPVYPSRATRSRWRHYERWRKPLGRFVAIADAACSYNPRFGQGMRAATVSARLLKDFLDTNGIDDPRLPSRFFSAQAQFQRTPWLFAAADDLRLPATEGKRSASVRLFNWYRPKLVACPDRRVGACLAEVTHTVKPISALFAPRVVSRVLTSAMSRRIKAMGRQASSDGLRPMPPDAERSRYR
jgi:2-polyprenyl-6-methoxyphenol hydroxylase-like FAD-dependent oxidoreductase